MIRAKTADAMAPVWPAKRSPSRTGQVLHADDTTVPVLAPGTGKTRTGRLWVVVRDERPFGSDIPPAAYYRYSPDRKGIHAQALLGRCRGFLHADGYAGFDSLYRPTTPDGEPPLIEVACWSHVRRKFYDIHHTSASPIAREAMERIAALFVIETSVRGQTPDRRLAARVQYARPRLDELKQFLQGSLKRISARARSPELSATPSHDGTRCCATWQTAGWK